MGIFTRFKDIISSNISSMLDKAEDPEKLIRLMLREMEETLVELKADCAATMAQATRTRQALHEAEDQVTLWHKRAELAVRANREDMAREALGEKFRAEERARALGSEAQQFETLVNKNREDIQLLEERIMSTREKQRLLVERQSRSITRRRAREQARAADALNSMQRFADLEQRITRMEHEADLAYTPPRNVHGRFQDLEQDEAISNALSAIREQVASEQTKTHDRETD